MQIFEKLKGFFNGKPVPLTISPFHERIKKSRRAVRTLKARADARRTFAEKTADWMTTTFGSITFLLVNIIVFVWWILINTHAFRSVEPFDPYPFNLLTTAVSLEAIVLAIFVLISQNREQKVNNLREEVDLQIDLIAETELTKAIEILTRLAKKQGVDLSKDQEIKEMLKPLDQQKIERSLSNEIKI